MEVSYIPIAKARGITAQPDKSAFRRDFRAFYCSVNRFTEQYKGRFCHGRQVGEFAGVD